MTPFIHYSPRKLSRNREAFSSTKFLIFVLKVADPLHFSISCLLRGCVENLLTPLWCGDDYNLSVLIGVVLWKCLG